MSLNKSSVYLGSMVVRIDEERGAEYDRMNCQLIDCIEK